MKGIPTFVRAKEMVLPMFTSMTPDHEITMRLLSIHLHEDTRTPGNCSRFEHMNESGRPALFIGMVNETVIEAPSDENIALEKSGATL